MTVESSTLTDFDASTSILHRQLIFANKFIRLYLPVPLVVMAFVGNSLSFLVMQRKKRYSKSSTCLYMQVLAVWDSLNITFNTLQRFIIYIIDDMASIGDVYCKQVLYMAHMSTILSFWLLVYMTFDRALVVWLPLRAVSLCTRKKATIVSASSCVVVAVCLLPNLMRYYEPNAPVDRTQCPFNPEWLERPLYVFVVFIGIFPPPMVVLTLNVCIMVALRRGNRKRAAMSSATGQSNKFENQLNVMLLLVSWTFLFLGSTYMLDYIYWELFWPPITLTQRLARKVSFEAMLYLLCCNNGINFYLYCFACQSFRNDLREIVRGRRADDMRSDLVSSTSGGAQSKFKSLTENH